MSLTLTGPAMRLAVIPLLAILAPLAASAQAPASATPAGLTDAQQVAAAVLPLPAEFRESATVLGYHEGARSLTTLRAGSGAFTCLAPDPAQKDFHVACYHRSMEPFMARGRTLRASGVTGVQVDSVRFRDVKAGRLKMPTRPAALYSLTGGSFDPGSGTTKGAQALYVVYIPFATPASTGIPAKPANGTPWIMYPGTPKAHIMFIPTM